LNNQITKVNNDTEEEGEECPNKMFTDSFNGCRVADHSDQPFSMTAMFSKSGYVHPVTIFVHATYHVAATTIRL
jgi:hypothetical protein